MHFAPTTHKSHLGVSMVKLTQSKAVGRFTVLMLNCRSAVSHASLWIRSREVYCKDSRLVTIKVHEKWHEQFSSLNEPSAHTRIGFTCGSHIRTDARARVTDCSFPDRVISQIRDDSNRKYDEFPITWQHNIHEIWKQRIPFIRQFLITAAMWNNVTISKSRVVHHILP